jgi:hypothetical protein
MTSHMVADSIILSDVLKNTGVAVGIIFIAYMGAKIERGSMELPWSNSGARKALGTPGLKCNIFRQPEIGRICINENVVA